MRLIYALLPAAVAATAAAAPPVPATPNLADVPGRHCPADMRRTAGPAQAQAHPLAAEPPADLYRAVDRRIDGCRRPVLIRRTMPAR